MNRDQKEEMKERLAELLTQCKTKKEFLELCWELFSLPERMINLTWNPEKNRVAKVNIDNHLIAIYPKKKGS